MAASVETKGEPLPAPLPPSFVDEIDILDERVAAWCHSLAEEVHTAIVEQELPELYRPKVLALARVFIAGVANVVKTTPLPDEDKVLREDSRRDGMSGLKLQSELAVLTPYKSQAKKQIQNEVAPAMNQVTFRPAIAHVSKVTGQTMLHTLGNSAIMSGVVLFFLYSAFRVLESVALYDENGLVRNFTRNDTATSTSSISKGGDEEETYYVYERNR